MSSDIVILHAKRVSSRELQQTWKYKLAENAYRPRGKLQRQSTRDGVLNPTWDTISKVVVIEEGAGREPHSVVGS